jgi:hypothetical protein
MKITSPAEAVFAAAVMVNFDNAAESPLLASFPDLET